MLIAIILMGILTSGQAQVFGFYGQSDRADLGGHPRCNCTSLGSGDHYCLSIETCVPGNCTPVCKCDMAEPEHPTPYAPLGSSLMLIPMAAGYLVAKKRGFWN